MVAKGAWLNGPVIIREAKTAATNENDVRVAKIAAAKRAIDCVDVKSIVSRIQEM